MSGHVPFIDLLMASLGHLAIAKAANAWPAGIRRTPNWDERGKRR